ncbi:MAG: AEC family transporter [Clostridiales bacterium]|jgi:predicted permease|nr:AEC family transporter [Clostridiales bacterium]
MTDIFNTMLFSIISLLVCLTAGYICRRARILNDNAIAALTELLIKVSLPCTVYTTMLRPFSMTLLTESLFVLVAFFFVHFLGMLVGFLTAKLLRANPNEKRVWMFAIAFANVGFMGYPIINSVLGEKAMIYASMVNISFNLLAYSVGPYLMNSDKSYTKYAWRGIFVTPAMIATVLGIICFVTSLRPPDPITDGVRYIAGLTTPISMLLLGAILAKSDIRAVFTGWKVYIVLAVRHFVMPLTVLAILKPFVHNSMALSVIVLLCAMPSASVTAILAQKYNAGADTASRLVFISTVISLLTVPVITLFL